jgi:hypothetical protein
MIFSNGEKLAHIEREIQKLKDHESWVAEHVPVHAGLSNREIALLESIADDYRILIGDEP